MWAVSRTTTGTSWRAHRRRLEPLPTKPGMTCSRILISSSRNLIARGIARGLSRELGHGPRRGLGRRHVARAARPSLCSDGRAQSHSTTLVSSGSLSGASSKTSSRARCCCTQLEECIEPATSSSQLDETLPKTAFPRATRLVFENTSFRVDQKTFILLRHNCQRTLSPIQGFSLGVVGNYDEGK